MFVKTLFLVFILFAFSSSIQSFENYKLIKIQSSFIKSFQDIIILSNDGSLLENTHAEVLASPLQYQALSNFSHQVLVPNYQKIIDLEAQQISKIENELNEKIKLTKNENLRYSAENWFRNYHKYEEHMAYVLKFKQDYPDMVEIETIGKSIEGRDLIVLKIHSPGQYNPSKSGIWINSGQHAREWV